MVCPHHPPANTVKERKNFIFFLKEKENVFGDRVVPRK
jgi:hypothetical protein